jgi:hypothetical protein
LFTAANPAIPAGGFVGESKHKILDRLKGAGPCLPHSTLLACGVPGERVAQAEEFMRQNGLEFPVVLKPDAGQRGSGVAIVRSADQLCEYLTRSSFPAILQEYVPGEEYGLFYYRYPDSERGRVFSVTEKRMPVLLGDGKCTLEELILADDRAVCMSDFYLRKHLDRTHEVPTAGERVQLVEIGTHCRGAIFLDGGETITPALEEVVDQIAKTFEGFFFGRFDIRVPSRQDFMAGRNLKIVELNGVTSEATHIYDPKLSLFEAYRVLFGNGGSHSKLGNSTGRAASIQLLWASCWMRLAGIPNWHRATRNDRGRYAAQVGKSACCDRVRMDHACRRLKRVQRHAKYPV